jgi:hypothetical protein
MPLRFFVLLLSIFIHSCIAIPDSRENIFEHPENYLDKEVRVCGQIKDSANLIAPASKRYHQYTYGLSIMEHGPLNPLYRGRICVRGVVGFVGCNTPDIICTDATFPYGIRIEDIIW